MQQSDLYDNFGTVRKERLEALLTKGKDCPLTLIEAAPGYGKSEFLAAYIQAQSYLSVWIHLRSLDNWEFFFWNHIVTVCSNSYPELGVELKKTAFPDTAGQFHDFISCLISFEQPKQVVIVLDDYSVLDNRAILQFIDNFIKAELPGIRIFVVSSRLTPLGGFCVRGNIACNRIGEEDLRVTAADVLNLYSEKGITITPEKAESIVKDWEGWPLPVTLIAEQQNRDPEHFHQPDFIYHLFYQGYYAAYPVELRRLFVQLSLVEQFDREVVAALTGQPDEAYAALETNPFIYHDHVSGTFQFRRLYRQFLTLYMAELSAQDTQAVYQAAADMLFQNNRKEDALPLLLSSGQYDRLIVTIAGLLTPYTEESKLRFLENQLTSIPQESIHNPKVELLWIALKLMQRFYGLAEKTLKNYLDRFEKNGSEQDESLGEAYVMRAFLSSNRMEDSTVEYLRKASEYLPNGSPFWKNQIAALLNEGYLRLPDNRPGAVRRTGEWYRRCKPYDQIILQKKDTGLEKLYWVEVAFYTYDLSNAQVLTDEMMLMAEQAAMHELFVLAHCYRAKIAMLGGCVQSLEQEVIFIRNYISEHHLYHLNGMRDQLYTYRCIYLNQLDQTPAWIIENGMRRGSYFEAARNGRAQTCYLLKTGNAHKVVALSRYLERICEEQGYWVGVLYFKLYRAVVLQKLGEKDEAIADLYAAYERTHANGIITPFIECAAGMRTLVDIARRQTRYTFESEWLNIVYTKASGYAKKLSTLQKHRQTDDHFKRELTPRRRQILQGLAFGYSLDEIAKQNQISINTVKTHVQLLYSQLGAVNRADAIRIATSLGMLDSG